MNKQIENFKNSYENRKFSVGMVVGIIIIGCLLTPYASRFFELNNLVWLKTFLFALSLSFLFTPLAIRLSFLLGWLDIPKGRKDHANATPLLGGFAIVAAFGLSLLLSYHYSLEMKGVGLAALLIWIVGVVDDRWELPAWWKLLSQVLAVVILLLFNVKLTFLPPTLWGHLAEYAITFFWVVGVTNTVNFLDGMDGLSGGMSAIISFFLAIVAVQTGQVYFAFIALAMLGACLGFLPYNFRRKGNARIFLGDNGSTFLGFTLAAAVIMGNWAEDNVAKLSVPLLLMAVPIFDMTLTTIFRFGTGKVRTVGQWLAYAGRDHFHHRLAALGIGRKAAVLVIWFITFFLGISAVVLKSAHGFHAILILFQAGLLFVLITFFMIYVRSHQIELFVKTSQDNGDTDVKSLEDALKKTDKSS